MSGWGYSDQMKMGYSSKMEYSRRAVYGISLYAAGRGGNG